MSFGRRLVIPTYVSFNLTLVAVAGCRADETEYGAQQGDAAADTSSNSDTGASNAEDGGAGDALPDSPRCRFGPSGVESLPNASPGVRCDLGCSSLPALQWDSTRSCKQNVVLCFECGVCGGGEQPGCFRNVDDGRLVSVQRWVMGNRPAWVECDGAENDMMNLGDPCP